MEATTIGLLAVALPTAGAMIGATWRLGTKIGKMETKIDVNCKHIQEIKKFIFNGRGKK